MSTTQTSTPETDDVDQAVADAQALDHEVDAAFAETIGETEEQAVADAEAYTRAEQRHYAEIIALNEQARLLRGEWLEAKEEAAAMKKRYESSQEHLSDLIQRGPTDKQKELPGFDESGSAAEWRELLVDELGLAAGIVGKLEDARIGTLGELHDYGNANGGYTSLDGIGPEKEAAIADAWGNFWSAHPEYSEAAIAEEDPE